MAALIMQMLALALQYGPQLGINVKNSIDRMENGETVEALITELDMKRDDLKELDFGR